MERLEFDGIDDLGDLLYELATKHNVTVTAVLFYKKAQALIRNLIKHEDIDICYIENFDDEYEKEYYITIDKDSTLYVSPAYKDKHYIREILTDGMFFDGDASSKIAVTNYGCIQFEICYKEKEYDECEFNEITDLLDYIFSIID